MNFNTVFKKNLIKYDNVKKSYILNLVTLCSWLPNHAIYFIVFAIKQDVSASLERNAHCANFAVYFLQTMV